MTCRTQANGKPSKTKTNKAIQIFFRNALPYPNGWKTTQFQKQMQQSNPNVFLFSMIYSTQVNGAQSKTRTNAAR
jgi:hypothetical protein